MASKFRFVLLLALALGACRESFLPVQVATPGDHAVGWTTFSRIAVLPFLTDFAPDSLPVDAELAAFFTRELAHYTPRPVVVQVIPCWEQVRRALWASGTLKEFRFADSAFFKAYLTGLPNLLLFAGKIQLSRSERSQMREEKVEGRKITAFHTVQVWEMKMDIELLEGGTGRAAFTFTATEKREQEPPVDAPRLARSMLDTLTDKFAHRLFTPNRTQERNLLLK
jgi:hypothetical protein